ncbi:hypothetical protein D5086_005302 [Populus alba]|uniref:Uncharacterized protein n=1 Tax=Populus alba TaxID=43335 RepID=A0ACC4CU03_POPAL
MGIILQSSAILLAAQIKAQRDARVYGWNFTWEMVTHVMKLCDHAMAEGDRFSGELVSLQMVSKASLIGVVDVVLHLCSKAAK